MLEKILRFLFPKTINKIINDSMEEAEIIYHYGSMENYYRIMNEYAEAMELEQQRIEAEIEADKYFETAQSFNDDMEMEAGITDIETGIL